MKLSKRIESVSASATIAITARAAELKAEGKDVVSFGAGEPDFDTPDFIKKAAEVALDEGDTKYTPRHGKALVNAILDKLQRENGLEYAPEEVVVTFGGKYGVFCACQVLLDPGDKVLIPAPYWVSYTEAVHLAGGDAVTLDTSFEDRFKITPDQIRQQGRDAKLLILNSPSNPTGVAYTPDELQAIADAVLETDLLVLSDEIYEKLIYGDTKFVSFAALDERLKERTLTLNGLSKTYAMTGWRLGWLAGPKQAIGGVRRLMSHSTTNPVSFAQAGGLAAYTHPKAPEIVEQRRQEFESRGKHIVQRLRAIPEVRCLEPDGAFYVFPDISAHYGKTIAGVEVTDSLSFAKAALEGGNVALVPGSAFGQDRCVRLSFATSMEQIDKGIDRLEKLLS